MISTCGRCKEISLNLEETAVSELRDPGKLLNKLHSVREEIAAMGVHVKILGKGDEVTFDHKNGWERGKPDDGSVSYKVKRDEVGSVFVHHPNGKIQKYPVGDREVYKSGAVVYVSCSTLILPDDDSLERIA
jgi:hypothetical protein